MNIKKELIEGITQDLIKFLYEEEGHSTEKAMAVVYNSKIFGKLTDVETGLYKESSSFVYELLTDEIKEGVIIQKEQ